MTDPTATEVEAGPPAERRRPRPQVEVRGLEKAYHRGSEEVHALGGVSFDLPPGEVVALVGPSGSGKSTLLNLLCGWEQPDRGLILFAQRADVPPAERPWSDLAVLPQRLGLIDELTVRENVELPVRLSGFDRPRGTERATLLLEAFGLSEMAGRSPQEVSLGEQQRTALARALILKPSVLLADEPTGHQDEGWGRTVFRAIRAAARGGSACLVATHNREVTRYADRVLAIRDGQVHPVGRDHRSRPPAAGEMP
jgi:putative ABC transport system ATP-binding protein